MAQAAHHLRHHHSHRPTPRRCPDPGAPPTPHGIVPVACHCSDSSASGQSAGSIFHFCAIGTLPSCVVHISTIKEQGRPVRNSQNNRTGVRPHLTDATGAGETRVSRIPHGSGVGTLNQTPLTICHGSRSVKSGSTIRKSQECLGPTLFLRVIRTGEARRRPYDGSL